MRGASLRWIKIEKKIEHLKKYVYVVSIVIPNVYVHDV